MFETEVRTVSVGTAYKAELDINRLESAFGILSFQVYQTPGRDLCYGGSAIYAIWAQILNLHPKR